MIELLPPTVAVAEARNYESVEPLLAEEASFIAGARAERRREFAMGRCLARRAMGLHGMQAVPLLPGFGGAPAWPQGLVGSITHCHGYCAVAVGLGRLVGGIGIDAEVNEALPPGVAALVLREEERDWLAEHGTREIHWDRVLFSAKESFYKVWYPLTGLWLEFQHVRITVHPDRESFRGELVLPVAAPRPTDHPDLFSGRFTVAGGLLQTAITLPAVTGAAVPSARSLRPACGPAGGTSL